MVGLKASQVPPVVAGATQGLKWQHLPVRLFFTQNVTVVWKCFLCYKLSSILRLHAYFSLGLRSSPWEEDLGVQVVYLGSNARTQGSKEVRQGEENQCRRCLLGRAGVSWGSALWGPLGDEVDIAQNHPIWEMRTLRHWSVNSPPALIVAASRGVDFTHQTALCRLSTFLQPENVLRQGDSGAIRNPLCSDSREG